MVLASAVVVVAYLVVGKLYLRYLFHLILLISVPGCRQYHVPLSCFQSTLFVEETRQAPAQEKMVALLHNPQNALLVFHSMDCSWFLSRSSNSTWTMHWILL